MSRHLMILRVMPRPRVSSHKAPRLSKGHVFCVFIPSKESFWPTGHTDARVFAFDVFKYQVKTIKEIMEEAKKSFC